LKSGRGMTWRVSDKVCSSIDKLGSANIMGTTWNEPTLDQEVNSIEVEECLKGHVCENEVGNR
jgi:hypothetical protein